MFIYPAQEVYKGAPPLKVPVMGPTIRPVKTTIADNSGRGGITVRLTDYRGLAQIQRVMREVG